MNTYMTSLLYPFTEFLKAFTVSSTDDQKLWLCIIGILKQSFMFDEGGEHYMPNECNLYLLRPFILVFWRDDKLRQIAPLLVEQVSVCIRLGVTDGKTALPICLEALTGAVNDDALLKAINLDLLMHTRSEDVRLRTFALTCSETLWRAHGGKLLGASNLSMEIFVATHYISRLCGRDSDIHR